MKAKKIYAQAWRLLEDVTPLAVDCGQLCGAACCDDGGHDDAGMYLFPYEEVMYKNKPDWIRIEKSDFEYGDDDKRALIAMCDGVCDRKMRPLACRIFPLTPYKKENEPLKIVMDTRAKAMCPLAKALRRDELDEKFVKAVELIFKVLEKDKCVSDFIIELSYLLDETNKFF